MEDSEEKERRRRSEKVGKLRIGAAPIRPPRGILGIRVLSRLAREWVETRLTTTPKRHREEAGLEGGRPLIERVGDIRAPYHLVPRRFPLTRLTASPTELGGRRDPEGFLTEAGIWPLGETLLESHDTELLELWSSWSTALYRAFLRGKSATPYSARMYSV